MWLIVESLKQLPYALAGFFAAIMFFMGLTQWALIVMFRSEFRQFIARPANLTKEEARKRQCRWDNKGHHYGTLHVLLAAGMTGFMIYAVNATSKSADPPSVLFPIFWDDIVPLFIVTILALMLHKCCLTIGLWYQRAAESGEIHPPPGVKIPPISIR